MRPSFAVLWRRREILGLVERSIVPALAAAGLFYIALTLAGICTCGS